MTTGARRPDVGTSQAGLEKLIAEILPPQGQWGAEGYLWLTDHTNRLIEFVDGSIEALPLPTDKHQTILEFLFLALRAFLRPRGGTVHVGALLVEIRPGLYHEPDVVGLRDARDPRRQDRYWRGADLVVEVVSPDDPARGLVEKRGDYAAARIPEYWIVDPRDETIRVLRLEGDGYVEHDTFGRGTSATSVLLAGFAVEVDAVFDAD